ncbi:hypothetical protein PAU_02370 [Photorhabdus asymbiotica]|uniref:Uncharacterized protein n=1 Tax=Photorhabdus asymbiotica subsp. asymbiotica (strain ATCC 43949 / 3105-77) TaxID=553480 RepID=C7BLL5_PHOAA|nr:hypothetical protein PAU_02370 [Photorhabdus asymbiotica]
MLPDCACNYRKHPGSIDNDVTGVSERSQQSSNLKDKGYKH